MLRLLRAARRGPDVLAFARATNSRETDVAPAHGPMRRIFYAAPQDIAGESAGLHQRALQARQTLNQDSSPEALKFFRNNPVPSVAMGTANCVIQPQVKMS